MPRKKMLAVLDASMDSSSMPLVVFMKLLAIVFIAEAGVMFVLPVILPESVDPGWEAFVDSCLLTLLAGPLVWWVIIGPLRASAAAEKLAVVAQMAAGVAHELRNPLTSVKMLVQSHRESPEASEPLAEDLEIIEDEIRRMERSIQTFLDFARPREPERQSIDPADVVQRVFSLIEPRTKNQDVDLKLEEADTGLSVHADAEQLFQVLLNLCGNALDVMPNGGSIAVRLEQTDCTVRIVVQDSGPGIDPAIRPKLFQPFVTNKEAGVGLGLLICKRIAEAHGGSLRAETLAKGACFTLELPANS